MILWLADPPYWRSNPSTTDRGADGMIFRPADPADPPGSCTAIGAMERAT